MRTLVLGGAGFIGSHLCERLLADGHEVVAFDDLSSGSRENLAAAARSPRFRLVQADARVRAEVDREMGACDAAFHLAALVGVRRAVEEASATILANVAISATILASAAAWRRPLLVTSSSEVYGTSTALPFVEETEPSFRAPDVGRWGYGLAKLLDETLALALWREQGLPVVVVRLFNTVGPRQSSAHGMVLPRLVEQVLAGRPLTVYGDGSQTRCFCHVQDVVDALVRLAAAPGAVGRVFNVGTDHEIPIRDVAARVLARAGVPGSIAWIPREHALKGGLVESARRVPSLARVRETVGWQAVRSLDDAIDDLLRERRNGRP